MNNMLKFNNEKYYWIYELPMTKSFFILFEVWKVLLVSILIINVFLNVPMALIEHSWASFTGMLQMSLIVLAIMLVLSIPAYWIVVKANNGKYTVMFEMDEEGIDHQQIKTDKAKALDKLTMMAGTLTGNASVVGAGLISSSGSSLYSRFSHVRKLIAYPGKNLIRVNGRLMRNQVYVDRENFDFVWSFLLAHCPNASSEIR